MLFCTKVLLSLFAVYILESSNLCIFYLSYIRVLNFDPLKLTWFIQLISASCIEFVNTDAPKDAYIATPARIIEGDRVKLNCSAKGNPVPTFTWFRNKTRWSSGPRLEFTSIKPSENGMYHCDAHNKHGNATSQPVVLDVQCEPFCVCFTLVDWISLLNYWFVLLCFFCDSDQHQTLFFSSDKPEVEIKKISPPSEVHEGDNLTLVCSVKRSNPTPLSYTWLKKSEVLRQHGPVYTNKTTPDDRGPYTCNATNSVGTGTSAQLQIDIQCKFPVLCDAF